MVTLKDKNKRKKCLNCEKELALNNFYMSYDPMHKDKKVPYCKDCLKDMLSYDKQGNVGINSLKTVLKIMNRPFLKSIWESSIKENPGNAFSAYIKNISLPQYRNYTWDNGDLEEELKLEQEAILKSTEEDFKVSEEMVARWGNGFDLNDYKFLENEFNKLITSYTCETPIQEMIYEEIAMTRLQASKSRRGDPKNYKVLMDTLRNLLTDANIKPNQELSDYGLNTWGEWIRKIEEEEPIPEASEEFKDVDGIRKYIDQWFVGHFSRIFGLNTQVDNTNGDT